MDKMFFFLIFLSNFIILGFIFFVPKEPVSVSKFYEKIKGKIKNKQPLQPFSLYQIFKGIVLFYGTYKAYIRAIDILAIAFPRVK